VNAWRTPKRVFDVHPADQYAQLRVDLRSPSLGAATSDASSSESRPCANARVSRAG
jgi:hypothetical protein